MFQKCKKRISLMGFNWTSVKTLPHYPLVYWCIVVYRVRNIYIYIEECNTSLSRFTKVKTSYLVERKLICYTT